MWCLHMSSAPSPPSPSSENAALRPSAQLERRPLTRAQLERLPSPGALETLTGRTGWEALFVMVGLYLPGFMFVLITVVEFVEYMIDDPNAGDLNALMLMMVMLTVMGITFGHAFDPDRLDYQQRQREKRARTMSETAAERKA